MLIALGHKRLIDTLSCGQAINERKERHHASQESSEKGSGQKGSETGEEGRKEEITFLQTRLIQVFKITIESQLT